MATKEEKESLPHFYLREENRLANNLGLTHKARLSILLAKADNTIGAYESDWKDFIDWCTYKDVEFFPATAETIVNYINDLADHAKANTISRRISALSENFVASGLVDNPCHHPLVRQALRGIRRMKGVYQRGKEPILLDELEDMVRYMKLSTLDPIVVARDKVVLLLGFMGAFRRSELSSIRVEHLRFSREGLQVFLPSSKADQEGQGSEVAIPYVEPESLCAVTAVKEWLDMTGITEGPLLRAFTKGLSLRKGPLSDKSVALIVKQYAKAIGLDPDQYGAHSLRHGFATTAAFSGVEERNIMRQTRHHSVNMVRRYINEANKFIDNPVDKIFKRY